MSTDVKDWTPAAIRELRQRLRLSQAEFAQRVGVYQAQVSDWERGINRVTHYANLRELDALDAESQQGGHE